MGIWHFASGPIADWALLALIGSPLTGIAPGASMNDAPGAAAAPWAVPRVAAITTSAPPAQPLMVDFTLSASRPGMAIRRSRDGLFYLDAWVNGVPVRFLVDTGATTVVLTPADAARAGVLPEAAAFRYSAQTAGGKTAMARIRLAQLTAGAAERRDVDAAIAGAGLGVSLLGQSYLSQLSSVRMSGDTMVLE